MGYKINRTLSGDGVYQYETDSGVKYLAKISESAPSSGLWTLNFVLLEGTPSIREVFATMNTLTEASMEFLDSVSAKNALFFIDGNKDEIEQKTKIFTRWIGQYWDYEVISNPEIVIPSRRDGRITVPTNAITMKRKEIPSIIKSNFCSNCGSPSNGTKFCSNCGFNLQGE